MTRVSRFALCIMTTAILAVSSLCSASDLDLLDCSSNADYLINVGPRISSMPVCKSTDKKALLAFKIAISSNPNDELSDWDASSDCCDWNSVTCDGKSGRVVGLNLAEKSLEVVIPKELGALSKLQFLKLYNNSLTGKLPSSLGSLSELAQFCVSGNGLTGSILSSYVSLANLLNLDVGNNKLSGQLPSNIGQMSNLKKINLSGNRFSGAITASFCELSNLFYANLGSNGFSGALPAAINNGLTSLIFLSLDNNKITAVPKTLNYLQNLQYLCLAHNPVKYARNLAGLATAPRLSQLDLSHCELSGTFT